MQTLQDTGIAALWIVGLVFGIIWLADVWQGSRRRR